MDCVCMYTHILKTDDGNRNLFSPQSPAAITSAVYRVPYVTACVVASTVNG